MKTIYLDEEYVLSERKMNRIATRIKRKCRKHETFVALSKSLNKNYELKDKLHKNKVEVLNGRWLFRFFVYDLVRIIREERRVSTLNIAFLMNNCDDVIIDQISMIAGSAKSIKIISNNLKQYTYIEDKLYNEYGIAVQLTNNKAKGLTKSEIIINIDFDEQELNKYLINPYAVIFNIKKDIVNDILEFKGTSISSYNLDFDREKFMEPENAAHFENYVLYESYIYRKDTFNNVYKQMQNDHVKLKKEYLDFT